MNDRETAFDILLRLLKGFENAIIVTRRPDGALAGRPMAIADSTVDGHLWFLTRADSSTIRDITDNPEVVACLQCDHCYLSLSGLARATRDSDRVDALWSPRDAVWYEKGKHDPNLILLEIVPTYGEYWDRSGIDTIAFRLQELRAMVTGETPEDVPGKHGDVEFR